MEPPVSARPQRDGRVRACVVQTKPHKGRYAQNLEDLRGIFAQLGAAASPPELVVLPEAALTGYFLEGAVYELALDARDFAVDLEKTWRDACGSRTVDIVCGFFENAGGTYYNSALYLEMREGCAEIRHVHRKMFLPTYGVFDEERFLSRGRKLQVFETRFGAAAMLICEDVWHAIVPTIAAIKGARILLVVSAAPGRGIEEDDELGSIARWRQILQATAAEHGVYLVYAGLAGFEGGKGMTGSSCIVDPRGRSIVEAPALGAHIVNGVIDLREIDVARAALPLLGDLNAVLPDLLLDDELPLHRCQPHEPKARRRRSPEDSKDVEGS
jgi:predicted amidohydrolase